MRQAALRRQDLSLGLKSEQENLCRVKYLSLPTESGTDERTVEPIWCEEPPAEFRDDESTIQGRICS